MQPAFAEIEIAKNDRKGPVDFEKEVLPILRKNCLACHNASDAESDVILETPQTILKGGSSGASVVPGKPMESMLLTVAMHADEPIMPPEDNEVGAKNLTPQELSLLKLWIEQGAKGEVTGSGEQITWQSLPPGVNPVYTTAITPNAQYAMAGRANQIFVYHLPTKQELGRLTDPALKEILGTESGGVAHLDLIQSMSINPAGDLLASGGYRNIKLWKRSASEIKSLQFAANSPGAFALSQDGSQAATGEDSGKISLWDINSGKLIKNWDAHQGAVSNLKFSNDGKRLLSGSVDKNVDVWNIGSAKSELNITTPSEVTAVAWVADESQVAAANTDGVIRIWSLAPPVTEEKPSDEKGKEETPSEEKVPVHTPLKELAGHKGKVNSLKTSLLDSKVLVSGGDDGTVRIWHAVDGKLIRQLTHGGQVKDVAIDATGQTIASASTANTIKLWTAANGKQLFELKGSNQARWISDEQTRVVALAKKEVDNHKKDLDAAKKRLEAEEANKKKTDENLKTTEEDLKKKVEALVKPTQEKAAADKQLADAKPALDKITAERDSAIAAATQAEADFKKSETERNEANKQKTERQKVFDLAKAALDKLSAAATAKEKALQVGAATRDAANKTKIEKEALFKKAEQDSKKELEALANPELEKATAERDAAIAAATKAEADYKKLEADRNEANKQKTESQKAFDLAKVEFDKLAAAAVAKEKLFQDGTNSRNAANKTITEKEALLKKAEQTLKTAEAAVKQKLAPYEKALNEKNASQRTVDAAKRSIVRATKTVKDAADKIPVEEQLFKTAEAGFSTQTEIAKKTTESYQASEKAWTSVAFSPDGKSIVAGCENGVVQTWATETGIPFESFTGADLTAVSVKVLPSGDLLGLTASGKATLWDSLPEWKLIKTIGSFDSTKDLEDRVTALHFSPDGKILASGGGNPSRSGELKLWSVDTGLLIREIKDAHSDTVFDVEFSADGKKIASCGADRFMKVFHVDSGQLDRAFEGHTHHVLGVSWRADGRVLVTSSADKVVKIWNALTGDQIRTVTGFGKEVTSIVHFRDARSGKYDYFATSSGDKAVSIRRSDNGGNVRSVGGSTDYVYSVAVSNDGTRLIAGGADSVLRVWNVDDGKLVVAFEPPSVEATGDQQAKK